jgi:hypothetical protein
MCQPMLAEVAPHHLIDRILVVILVDDETSDLHDVVESARTSANDALEDLPGELSLGYRDLVVELGRYVRVVNRTSGDTGEEDQGPGPDHDRRGIDISRHMCSSHDGSSRPIRCSTTIQPG